MGGKDTGGWLMKSPGLTLWRATQGNTYLTPVFFGQRSGHDHQNAVQHHGGGDGKGP